MKNINIDFTGIGINLLALTTFILIATASWFMIQQTTLENENKRKMFEYELKEKKLKIQNDSINLESSDENIRSIYDFFPEEETIPCLEIHLGVCK